MTEESSALRKQNYTEFITTIPPDVKQLAGKILRYFREHPTKFNYMFADSTVYIYLMDDEFKTIISIVDYLGADTDSPPFKPYRNNEEDEFFGDLNFYLKLNQEIMDGSGYLQTASDDVEVVALEPGDVEVDDLESGVEDDGEVDNVPEVSAYNSDVTTPSPSTGTEAINFEEPTEELDTDIPEVEEYVEASDQDIDTVLDVPEEVSANLTVSDDDEIYWDNVKLIAKGIDDDALELMKRVHTNAGMIVPITLVRIGSKLLIRTNGDQDSFDEHYDMIRQEAEGIFVGATSVTATKNNVQILFGQ